VKVAAHGGPPPSFFIPAAKGKSRARISLNSLKYAIIERLVGGANLEGENIVLRQQVIVLSRKARSRSDGKSSPRPAALYGGSIRECPEMPAHVALQPRLDFFSSATCKRRLKVGVCEFRDRY
jgi:hypothetical protein